jgi:hypothetical protein
MPSPTACLVPKRAKTAEQSHDTCDQGKKRPLATVQTLALHYLNRLFFISLNNPGRDQRRQLVQVHLRIARFTLSIYSGYEHCGLCNERVRKYEAFHAMKAMPTGSYTAACKIAIYLTRTDRAPERPIGLRISHCILFPRRKGKGNWSEKVRVGKTDGANAICRPFGRASRSVLALTFGLGPQGPHGRPLPLESTPLMLRNYLIRWLLLSLKPMA